jgi:Holliday junction DNA helicase RuvA
MFAYIKGVFAEKTPTSVVVETNGIGYELHISLQTYAKIENLPEGKLWTHLYIKDDSHLLYGFSHTDERDVFRQLITVSGIGTNTARLILSAMSSAEVKNAILAEDETAFRRIKGIGAKTAKRLIIDLKDKVLKDDRAESLSPVSAAGGNARAEAMSALLALGFHRTEVQKVLNQLEGEAADSTEELIKLSLKALSRR